MVLEYRFNQENFSMPSGWSKEVRKIDADVLAEKVVDYYSQEREMTGTEHRVYKKVLDLLKNDKEIKSLCTEYEAWKFDINDKGISMRERKDFLEVLGVLYAKIEKPHKDGRKVIPVSFTDENMYNYILEKLPRSDVLIRKPRDSGSGQRHELTMRNPAYSYYFYNHLPSLSMESGDALLSGIITTCTLGTINRKAGGEGDVIAFITGNERVSKRIRLECAWRKIWEMSFDDYVFFQNTKISKGDRLTEFVTKYSTFFLKPKELGNLLFKDDRFKYISDVLTDFTDFSENAENAVIQRTLYGRRKIVDWGIETGLLSQTTFQELKNELDRLGQEHREVKRDTKNLERKLNMLENFPDRKNISEELTKKTSESNSLQSQIDAVEERRSKLKKSLSSDKGSNFSYARKVARDKLKEQ